MKQQIIELLRSTERPGIENLINHMEEIGFFTAPCSTQYHLCKEGGLAEHSLNVYLYMKNTAAGIGYYDPLTDSSDSIIITSLLHDLGKAGQYGKPNYIPNMIQDKKNKGEYVRSEAKPYETNKDLLAVPHEIRSIHIASQFIELTEQESFAILFHNNQYTPLGRECNGKETPLMLLLYFADLWCSRVIENKD
jgi:23S rRNA maturation-related 3'-5' exoribonuclease YhaM